MPPMRPVHLHRYHEVAKEAHTLVAGLLSRWVGVTPEDAQNDPLPMMVHLTAQNHCRRLEATLKLHDVGLADVCTTLVRLGYEDLVWIHYFYECVPKAERFALLQALTGRELVKRHRAQRNYHGEDGIRKFGFSAEAHEELEKQIPAIKAEMKRLRAKLGWPDAVYGDLQEPPVTHLVDKLNWKNHGFFSSAPSQFMHFSAWRLSGGVTRGEDGRAVPRNAYFEEIDAGFALGWVANDALNVAYLADIWAPELGEMLSKIDASYKVRARHLIARIDAIGPPPLLEAYQIMRDQPSDGGG